VRIAALTSIVSLVLGGAFFVACSSSSSGGGGGTGAGGSGGQVVTGGSGGATGGTTSTGGGTNTGGGGGTVPDVTGSCASVCGSADPQGSGSGECYCDSACAGNGDCCSDFQSSCTVTMPSGCLDATKLTAFCNPVTNEGCSGTGVACDLASGGAFACFDPPNDVQPGGSCENANGPWCIAQYHCDQGADAGNGTCKKYCCTNADCTGGGNCVAFDSSVGTIGVCDTGGGTGGTGGTGGAPSDAGTD
jgi:hypothetical protein